MEIKIKLYGAEWCTNCKLAKAYLQENNINYEFVDVSTSDDPYIEKIDEIPVAICYKNSKEHSVWCQKDGDLSSWLKMIEW